MSSRSGAALGIWDARNVRTSGDRAFLVYATVLAIIVLAAPVARAVWVSAISTEGVALLSSSAAPGAASLGVAALWAAALLLGRDRGPALLPSFPMYALATSDLPRSSAFRRSLLRAGALVTSTTTIIAGLIGSSLASQELATPRDAVTFAIVGAVVGVITTVVWLTGQVFSRAAIPVALAVIVSGLVTTAVPALQQLPPWGCVGLTYPGAASSSTLVGLAALAVTLIAAVPGLMNRLDYAELAPQAARWDSATISATGMDFSAIAGTYRARPHHGRRLRAVRPTHPLALTFLIRDLIGAARTPGRLITGVLAIAAAGALATLAFIPTMPGALLGATAGLILFAGLGPLTDGIRHAVDVSADFPIYGISDERLLLDHSLLPLLLTTVVLTAGVITCAVVTGTAGAAPVAGTLILGLIALIARIGNALKGPLPPVLLTPIPTSMGDLGAAVRVAWAIDGVMLTALAGSSAALVLEAPALLIGVIVTLAGMTVHRWRHRS